MRSLNYKEIEKRLGVAFRRKTLLRSALIHSSFSRNHALKVPKNNETLEFLGDAVLELIVREHLYRKFPGLAEGELNEMKVRYTNTDTLHRVGEELRIGEFLLMDRGEELTGGRARSSNIAGALEAVIGAVYLDQGLKGAQRFVKKHILAIDISGLRDYKSLLNRWAMQQQRSISYRVARSHGPPHRKVFHIDLCVDSKKVSRGSGDSKKKAQQSAARQFLEEQKITED
ncbi:ribonuclease III [candidate division WOR-3 bacterium]|nr:ribonuclease III [candidate division WOR-3 bacterium]